MIGEQIENNINKEPKSKIHLIVSVLVIVLIVILFAVFMRLDFSKPEQEQPVLSPQERGSIIDEATKDMEFSTVEERSASVSNVNIKGNQEARMRAVNQ